LSERSIIRTQAVINATAHLVMQLKTWILIGYR